MPNVVSQLGSQFGEAADEQLDTQPEGDEANDEYETKSPKEKNAKVPKLDEEDEGNDDFLADEREEAEMEGQNLRENHHK